MLVHDMTPPRFDALAAGFAQAVESGDIPGAAVIVVHDGETISWSGGYRDRAQSLPIEDDTIFRTASLTKIVTAVAAMKLVEASKLMLGDPLSRYFPRLANLRVGVPRPDAAGSATLGFESAQREITVLDLMRHTSGFTYGQFSDSLVQKAYRDAQMSSHEQTADDILRKLADLPLAYQPGSTFEYGMSTDVLGWLVEIVAEQSLDGFIRETIAPLGLSFMGFRPAPEQIARIAQSQVDKETGEIPVLGSRNFYEAGWISGGHGLFTTARDFEILGRKTLALMTSDHLPQGVRFGTSVKDLGALAPVPDMGQGFGLGFAVRTMAGRNTLPGSVGDFGWAGLSGTYFWADPEEKLCAVLMMQAPLQRSRYRSPMRQWVYQAVN